ncbi:MAG: hypothetical protein KC502_19115 [Myxococcales bacterium]|nr:hypothetical protein [Myxococcales bacterium]
MNLSPSKRRWIAMIGLAVGLIAAWWQTEHSTSERQLAVVLTHVEARLGDVALDRKELTRVDLMLEPGHVKSLHFAANHAPKATAAQELALPSEATTVMVRCRFTLPSGAHVRTQGHAPLPTETEGVQVLDIGTCGRVVP